MEPACIVGNLLALKGNDFILSLEYNKFITFQEKGSVGTISTSSS